MTLALGAAACGDDDEDPTTDATTTSTTDTSTNTDTSTTTDVTTTTTTTDTSVATETTDDATVATETADDATVTPETEDDTTTSNGACDNASDRAASAANDPAAIAQNCGIACLSAGADPAVRTCAQDCIVNGKGSITGVAISMDCAGCYADAVICAKNKCLAVCLDGGQDCADCREDQGCNADFYECSGLTP